MAGYLIGEEGPLAGQIVRFEEGKEWVLGRNPDETTIVLEDPMVSRKHVICKLTYEGYILENLSSVNPATQNGRIVTEPVLLKEGDIVQIGQTFFRFTEKTPQELESHEIPPFFEEAPELTGFQIELSPETRWILKVIAGPNTGAEFGMKVSSTYILGKDPNLCDIVFQDLSVSRQHARISIDPNEQVTIEDLKSRNGVLVNGRLIQEPQALSQEDVIAVGTTTFVVVDRERARETLIAPAIPSHYEAAPAVAAPEAGPVEKTIHPMRNWKEMVIPKKTLVLAGFFSVLILLLIIGLISLFKTQPVLVHEKNETEQIKESIYAYPDVQFSFNQATGKLFLVGHVLTSVDHQELLYLLKGLSFIQNVDDNVVIDEYVWQNINALLSTNPLWQSISIYSPTAGKFVMRGYLQSPEQWQELSDYLNLNFPYLDRLENQVVVENNLATQIQSMLVAKGFGGVTFQLTDGELVLSGRVDEKNAKLFKEMADQFKALLGIRSVKNYVVLTTAQSSQADLSDKYQVVGYSKKDAKNFYVVINGKILSIGDTLDGMTIMGIEPRAVLLEKDGIKFRINYNLQ